MESRKTSRREVHPGSPAPSSRVTADRAARRGRFLFCVVSAIVLLGIIAGVAACSGGATGPTAGAVAVAQGGVTTTASTLPATTTTTVPPPATTSISAVSSTTTSTIYTHPIALPARIVIPAIKAEGPIVSVGLAKNGAMEVPNVKYAGWYKLGPVPGASGPAVVVAHVSYGGVHGIFYDLRRLEPGDQIRVYDQNGDCAIFEVDARETVLKTQLPTERIWNNTQESVIRLITCGGAYDRETKHYLSNIIVYAHLAR